MSNKKEKKTAAIIERLKKVKHIEIIIAVLFIAILIVIYFVSFGNKNKSTNSGGGEALVYNNSASFGEESERKLRQLIESISGVGAAEVMINYESTAEKIVAYIENITENYSDGEKSSSTSSKNPIIIGSGNAQIPLILKELAPKVTGILIVAQGASNPTTRLNIINAVSVLMGISTDKIAVLERNKG